MGKQTALEEGSPPEPFSPFSEGRGKERSFRPQLSCGASRARGREPRSWLTPSVLGTMLSAQARGSQKRLLTNLGGTFYISLIVQATKSGFVCRDKVPEDTGLCSRRMELGLGNSQIPCSHRRCLKKKIMLGFAVYFCLKTDHMFDGAGKLILVPKSYHDIIFLCKVLRMSQKPHSMTNF